MGLIRSRSFLRNVSSPRGMVEDFAEVYRQAGKNRWWIAIASAACTIGIFSMMWHEGGRGLPRPPIVTYITVWDPHRTQAEIVASNIANQRRKDWLAAQQAKRDDEVRAMYRTIGRASGMDVDAIEKKAKAEQAVQAAKDKAMLDAAVQPASKSAAPQSSAPQPSAPQPGAAKP